MKVIILIIYNNNIIYSYEAKVCAHNILYTLKSLSSQKQQSVNERQHQHQRRRESKSWISNLFYTPQVSEIIIIISCCVLIGYYYLLIIIIVIGSSSYYYYYL